MSFALVRLTAGGWRLGAHRYERIEYAMEARQLMPRPCVIIQLSHEQTALALHFVARGQTHEILDQLLSAGEIEG